MGEINIRRIFFLNLLTIKLVYNGGMMMAVVSPDVLVDEHKSYNWG